MLSRAGVSPDALQRDTTTDAGGLTWRPVPRTVPRTWRGERKGSCSAPEISWSLQAKQRGGRCLKPLQRVCLNFSPYLVPISGSGGVCSTAGLMEIT